MSLEKADNYIRESDKSTQKAIKIYQQLGMSEVEILKRVTDLHVKFEEEESK